MAYIGSLDRGSGSTHFMILDAAAEIWEGTQKVITGALQLVPNQNTVSG